MFCRCEKTVRGDEKSCTDKVPSRFINTDIEQVQIEEKLYTLL
jgi:hypothetical protein